jgi:glutamate synthase (NADPH/NADH) large chain
MMLIPEAWAGNPLMDGRAQGLLRIPCRADGAVGRPRRRGLHRRRQIGATLDRNGLRPAASRHRRRPCHHGLGIGVLPVPEEKHRPKWRLQPGKMLLIDMEKGRIIEDEEIKSELAEASLQEWLNQSPSSSSKT